METNSLKEYCLTVIKSDWLAASTSFPEFIAEISPLKKDENMLYIQENSFIFNKQLKRFPRLYLLRKRWKKKMFKLFENILNHETIIGIHNYMDKQDLDALQSELMQFLCQTRSFAPELNFDGIGQAIRNYIVYAMFKQLNCQKAGFNQACFGYSMLYPFTDNYIDNPDITNQQKAEYNRVIRDKIQGKTICSKSIHTQKTCDLLRAIEDKYPRSSHKDIYDLLLMMLEAQEDSMQQQCMENTLTQSERLDISIYKGGISVLIDYFFVDKELAEEDLYFYLSFGFFLQLADDLQDIKEDSNKGNQTIFTQDLNVESEELIVNKMFHFIHHIMNQYNAPSDSFKQLLLANCYQLILTSVAESEDFFSERYKNQLEGFLPVTYPFLKSMKENKFEKKDSYTQERYMLILDEMLIP